MTTTPAPLCFIDTETTSLRPDRRAWEIALIRRDYQSMTDWTDSTLVMHIEDIDLSAADPAAMKIGGFYDRHAQYVLTRHHSFGIPCPPEHLEVLRADAEDARQRRPLLTSESIAARQVEEWTRGAVLVGVGVAFDAQTLDPLLRDYGRVPSWHYSVVDVKAMAAGWLRAWASQSLRWAAGTDGEPEPLEVRPGLLMSISEVEQVRQEVIPGLLTPPWRSDDLSRACGVEPPSEEDRHTALGDARWAMRWYDAMTGGAQ